MPLLQTAPSWQSVLCLSHNPDKYLQHLAIFMCPVNSRCIDVSIRMRFGKRESMLHDLKSCMRHRPCCATQGSHSIAISFNPCKKKFKKQLRRKASLTKPSISAVEQQHENEILHFKAENEHTADESIENTCSS